MSDLVRAVQLAAITMLLAFIAIELALILRELRVG